MEIDFPLTDLFCCPLCGFREMFKAEPVAYVKCICGSWWVIGDYEFYLSLNDEEREKLKIYYIGVFNNQREWNQDFFGIEAFYS